jgi:hypothetical protein
VRSAQDGRRECPGGITGTCCSWGIQYGDSSTFYFSQNTAEGALLRPRARYLGVRNKQASHRRGLRAQIQRGASELVQSGKNVNYPLLALEFSTGGEKIGNKLVTTQN